MVRFEPKVPVLVTCVEDDVGGHLRKGDRYHIVSFYEVDGRAYVAVRPQHSRSSAMITEGWAFERFKQEPTG